MIAIILYCAGMKSQNRRKQPYYLKTCSFLIIAMIVISAFTNRAQAWQGMATPMLHVSGRNLQNPSGHNVCLMGGWMQPTASWFNGQGRWYSDPTDWTNPSNVADFLDFMKEAADVMSDTSTRYGHTHGWYCTFVRVNTDAIGGWTSESGLVNSTQFNAWINNFIVPYADHLRSRGLYLVLSATGPINTPDNGTHNAGVVEQQRLITFWETVANASGVKNADNIMFELMNEPVDVESSPGNGDWGNHAPQYFSAFRDWIQPIIDTIRNTGADNVIWVPTLEWQGSPYQWDQYPFSGSNIGVACHFYPAYGGVFDNTTALQNLWNSQYRPATDHWPMIITECFWFPIPEDPRNLCNGTTAGFGSALKGCIDSDGNVSWMIGFLGDVLDLNNGRPQDCSLMISKEGAQAAFEWWQTYTWCAPDGTKPGNPAEPVNGLEYKYYEGTWDMLPDFDSLTPVEEGLCANFDVSSPPSADYFGFVFEGYVDIPADGTYTFYTTSDEGSKLYIGPPEVVNNDGLHEMQEASGQIGLQAGMHAIRVTMFEKGGDHGLEVRWEGPGTTKELIPNSALYRDTTPPAAPAGLMATPDDGEVWLDWNNNSEPDLAGYKVYRSTTPGSDYSKINGPLPLEYLTISEYIDSSVTNGTTYYYVVTAVDSSGNESSYSSEVGDVMPSGGGGSGTILREWWEGIGGTAVSNLTSNQNYPDNRTGCNELTSFEAPTDWADNYGTRVRGYIHPVFTDEYTFWIAGDDNCELWLSTDENPANASLIAYVPGWTNSQDWTKYTNQQSAAISLTAGQKYYIEALHKEGNGGDNLAVAWQSTGIGRKVIPGSYLSPWPPPAPTGLTATSTGEQVTLNWMASITATGYNVKRSTTSGGPYTTIAANVTTTSYIDTDVVAGTTYHYVVSAVGPDGESADSAEATPLILHAYLNYDETSGTTASDVTGNGWDGTLISGPTWTAGKYHNAVNLDGSNDYVSLPSGVVDGLTDFTISAWVYPDIVSDWSRVFDFGTGTSVNMFLTPSNGWSHTVRFAITTSGAGAEQVINGDDELPAAGAWTHVAVTLDGNTGILYVNGDEVGRNSSMSLTPDSLGVTTNNYIGRSQYPDPYLNGHVDDFRIYSSALSPSEVEALASNDQPYFTSDPVFKSDANEDDAYTGQTLAGDTIDPDSNPIVISKVSGPAWLTVASDGLLSGTPSDSDVGENVFTVRVEDTGGLYDTACMIIYVTNIYSGVRGIEDLAGLVAQWLVFDCADIPACDGADLDGDADVDFLDFAELADNW